MVKIYLLLPLTLLLNKAAGQAGDTNVYCRLFVDKPTLKQDTASLVKHGDSKLLVYQLLAEDNNQ